MDNFKLVCIKIDESNEVMKQCVTVDKVYEFKNGKTIWDDSTLSAKYLNARDFLENGNWGGYFRVANEEDYTLTCLDLFNYPDGTKFKIKFKDGSGENITFIKRNGEIIDQHFNCPLPLNLSIANARFKKVGSKKIYKSLIDALELIKSGKEVYCEYNNEEIFFNNPSIEYILFEYILNGKWYVTEEII